jgi:hemolysin D
MSSSTSSAQPSLAPGRSPTGRPRRRTTLPRSTRGWSRGIVWTLIGLTVFGVIYSLLAKIDTSVSARGKISTIKGTADLSPSFTAVVDDVLVKEGQLVKPGEILVRMRDPAAKQVVQDLTAVESLILQDLAVQQNLLGLPDINTGTLTPLAEEKQRTFAEDLALREEIAAQQQERARIEFSQQQIDLSGLKKQLEINESITSRMRALQNQGAISRLDLERNEEQLIKLRTAYKRAQLEERSAITKRSEAQLRRRQVLSDDRQQLLQRYTATRQQLLDVQRQISEQEQRLEQQTIKAPIEGRVFDLAVSKGGVASPNEVSLKIVPEGAVQAKVFVPNKDIGFLKLNMPADVRIDSYPFTEYGSLEGRLSSIGLDSLPPDQSYPFERFPIVIKLNEMMLKSRGKDLQLRSGMSITALIKLEERPVISLISDRFSSFFDSARTSR